jgi:creatinine amidohydrolase
MRANPTYLAECTWPEASTALDGAVILLPVGAIEAHGPHLPLNTDVVIAKEIAVRAAKLVRGPSLVLPEISYGVSFVGTCFPGTTPVPPDALTRMVNEIIVTLLDYGAAAAIIVNAHLEPAHMQALSDARERAAHATQKPVAFADLRQERWASRLSAEFVAGMRHAGAYETSLMLSVRPDSVRHEFLSGLEPVNIDLPAALRTGARTFAEAGGTLGYFGNPRDATAEEGDKLFDALAAIMIDALGEAEHENAETPEL